MMSQSEAEWGSHLCHGREVCVGKLAMLDVRDPYVLVTFCVARANTYNLRGRGLFQLRVLEVSVHSQVVPGQDGMAERPGKESCSGPSGQEAERVKEGAWKYTSMRTRNCGGYVDIN